MNMPEIGFLIASRYNVIFHNITTLGSMTYVPLRSILPPWRLPDAYYCILMVSLQVPIKVQVQLRPISMATAAAGTSADRGTNQRLSAPIKRQVHLPPTPARTTSPMGPVLDSVGIPLSAVKGIARQIRIKALDLLLKGSERGSMMAMMDAWLVYWDIRKKEEGVRMEAGMFFWLPVADLQSAIDGVL
ncbi:hypothetical protein Tco_1137520 [Tanacetum coccineum]